MLQLRPTVNYASWCLQVEEMLPLSSQSVSLLLYTRLVQLLQDQNLPRARVPQGLWLRHAPHTKFVWDGC